MFEGHLLEGETSLSRVRVKTQRVVMPKLKFMKGTRTNPTLSLVFYIPSDFEDRYPSDEIEVSPSMPCLNIQPSCAPNPPHYEDKNLYSYDNFSKYTPFDNSTDKI